MDENATKRRLAIGPLPAWLAKRAISSSLGLIALVLFGVVLDSPVALATERWPGLEEAACPFDVPHGVSEGKTVFCGFVTVPERHGAPAGASIRLAVAIFPSSAKQPEPDPIVLIRGGPGESTLTVFAPVAASSIGKRFLKNRDIVLIELRGTHYSQPSLDCPEWDAYIDRRLEEDIRSDEDLQLDLKAISQCHNRLLSEGVDLSAFNSMESAADIPFVTKALDYGKFNLFATSAATLIAQHLMREQPDSLRSVILDSPLPLAERPYADFVLGADESLGARFTACTGDSRCQNAFPDPAGLLLKAIEEFNREPVTVTVVNPNTDKKTDVVINGDRVAELVYDLLSDSEAVPALPLLVETLAEGDASLVPTFAGALFHPENFSRGLQYSALCAEEINFTEADIGMPGRNPEFEQVVASIWPRKLLAGCKFWSVDQLPPVVDRPVRSSVPTLIVSGQFDILPAAYGPGILAYLSNGQLVTIPGAAHTPTGSGDCSLDIAEGFFDSPSSPVDVSCLNDIEIRFVVEPLARRLLLSEPPVLRLAVLLSTLLAMVSLPVTAAWRHFRAGRAYSRPVQLARRALAVAVGLNLILVVAFLASNPLEAIYGFSPLFRAATWLPLLSLLPAAVALALVVVAWRRTYLGPPGSIHHILVALGVLVFVWQLSWWHLLAL